MYDNDGETKIPASDIAEVTFTILRPGGDPTDPDVDQDDGTVVDDGHGQYVVVPAINDTAGGYTGIATFTYTDGVNAGLTKSIPCNYEIADPYVRTGASVADPSVRLAWTYLEDCFDSEAGGPWLRDMTKNVFDESKLRALVPQVITGINLQMPFSSWTEDSFPYQQGDGVAFVAQGLLVAAIRHLMRSYVEQPDTVSSPVAFLDRKKYQAVWKAQYDVEKELWDLWLNRYKLAGYDLAHGALLVGVKAGRMLPAPMRSRNVGRGF